MHSNLGRFFIAAFFLLSNFAYAQPDNRGPSILDLQSREASGELPNAALPGSQQRASGAKNLIGKRLSTGQGLQIQEKPNQPPGVRFTTQVETKIENKTFNQFGGGAGADRPEPVPSEPLAREQKNTWRADFESMVVSQLGRSVPLFGESFFSSSEQFKPNEAIAIPDNYVLAVGDEVQTRAWGEIEIDHTGAIDRDGNLFVPRIGAVRLAGTKLSAIHSVLKGAIGANYRNFQLAVSLNTTRTITVHAVGLARRPGSHQISAYSNFIDAIMAVGGPSNKANFRNVRLKRAGRIVAELDLYIFMSKGRSEVSIKVEANDEIVFEVAGQYAALVGQVVTPAIFQLTPLSTLAELLLLSGGFDLAARRDRVLIERTDDNFRRTAQWVEVSSSFTTFKLEAGDIVTVLPMSPKLENVVSLQGEVAIPLRQPWREGLKVSDLIPSAEFLVNPEHWQRHNDRTSREKLSIAVTKQEIKPPGPNVHWEYASIERLNPGSQSTNLVAINLRKAIIYRDPLHDVMLQPGDILTVYSQESMRVASSQKRKHVRIEGEVGAAGVYPLNDGENLVDLIRKAGGLGRNAHLFGVELQRVSTRELQMQRLQEIADRLESDLLRSFASRTRNIISTTEADAAGSESDAIKSLLAKVRSTKPTGRVVLGLSLKLESFESLPDITLEDLDTIFVPKLPNVVNVMGSVVQSGSFLFEKNKAPGHYLKQAGGTSAFADRANIYVIRADGSVHQTGQWVLPVVGVAFGGLNVDIFPGDTIVVPEHVNSTTLVKNLRDWTQVLYQFGLGAAGLKILRSN
jgi:polysaccharide biosynthesis/export protein